MIQNYAIPGTDHPIEDVLGVLGETCDLSEVVVMFRNTSESPFTGRPETIVTVNGDSRAHCAMLGHYDWMGY